MFADATASHHNAFQSRMLDKSVGLIIIFHSYITLDEQTLIIITNHNL